MALNVNEDATDGYVVRRSLYSPVESGQEFGLKQELLTDTLNQFERKVGTILSVMRVKKLSINDRASMKIIGHSLDALRPFFHNVDVP